MPPLDDLLPNFQVMSESLRAFCILKNLEKKRRIQTQTLQLQKTRPIQN